MRSSRPIYSALRSTALAAAVLSLFLLGSLGSFIHRTVEHHKRCAEHGQWTHTAHADHHDADDLQLRAAVLQDDTAAPSSPHHHCALDLCLQKSQDTRTARATAAVRAATNAPGLDQLLTRRSASILLHAPKTSPPAALHA